MLQEVGFLPLLNQFMLSGVSLLGCGIGGSLAGLVAAGWASGSVLASGPMDLWSIAVLNFIVGATVRTNRSEPPTDHMCI